MKLDYREVIERHKELWGKTIKPVKSRDGKNPVPKEVTCPYCGAPHEYLYDNSGGRGQILCKVCSSRFSRDKEFVSPVSLFCPYCGRSLSKIKTRKGYSIHKCVNDNCSFYKGSLKKLSPEDKLEYETHPERYQLRYLYREFHLKFFEMELYSMPKGSVNFKFKNFSPHILGLCLTYMGSESLMLQSASMPGLPLQSFSPMLILMTTNRLHTLPLTKPMSRSRVSIIMSGLSWM